MAMISGERTLSPQTIGILCVLGAVAIWSAHDVVIKSLSTTYPLHQITFVRGVVAAMVTLLVFVPFDGGWRNLITRYWRIHIMRAALVITANMSFYAGLASLPLGEATAIYFFAPLVITALSALFLREHVGPRRWAAVTAGFVGVILVIRPGADAFQPAALLPLLSAVCYGALQVSTRYMGLNEKASTMSFYMQFAFVVFSATVGLMVGDGRFSGSGDPSLEFVSRAWQWPTPEHWAILVTIGLMVSGAAYMMSQAYRIAEGGLVAPFEYIGMPLSILYGVVFWGDWPEPLAWAGIALIGASGVYVFLREAWLGRKRDEATVREES